MVRVSLPIFAHFPKRRFQHFVMLFSLFFLLFFDAVCMDKNLFFENSYRGHFVVLV